MLIKCTSTSFYINIKIKNKTYSVGTYWKCGFTRLVYYYFFLTFDVRKWRYARSFNYFNLQTNSEKKNLIKVMLFSYTKCFV